jgi:ribosomal protein S27E
MATNEVTCPICSADVPLAGDEAEGEEIFCGVCGAVLKLTGNAEDEDVDCEEDM